MNGAFATSQDLSTVLQNAANAMLQVGKVLNTGQTQQLQAQQTLDNQALQEGVNADNQLAVANTAIHYEAAVSPSLAAFNAPAMQGCVVTAGIGAVGSGLAASRSLASALTAAIAQYNDGNVSGLASVRNMAQATGATLSATSIFSPAANGATTGQSAQVIAGLTNPLPAVAMTTAQQQTPAGQKETAMSHAVDAKLSASQSALAQIAAWNTPVIQESDFASATGLPVPARDIANGKISQNVALRQMAQARYANQNWYFHLAQESQTGAVKTMVQMEAARLAMHWQMLRMDEHLVQISAAEYAHEVVSPATAQLNGLAGNALAESNGSLANSSPGGNQ